MYRLVRALDGRDGVVQAEIAGAFQALAKGEGVRANNLKRSLDSHLKAVRDCLQIDMDASDADVSRAVAQNLLKLIDGLSPPRPYGGELSPHESDDRFRTVVKVCFNLMKHPGLEGRDLTGRQKWLAEEWRAPRRASVATSRRYLKEAAEQFGYQIISGGFVPVSGNGSGTEIGPVQLPTAEVLEEHPAVASPETNTADGPVTAYSAAVPLPVPTTRGRLSGFRFVMPAVALALVLITSLVLALEPDGSHSPASLPPPTAVATTSASAASPVLAAAAQLAAPTTDNTRNSAWVLPRVLPASDAAILTAKGIISATWAPGMGGVLVGDANFVVTLTGEAADGLTITNITTTDIKRGPSLTGTLIETPPQGENLNQQYLFNLAPSPAEALWGDELNPSYGQPVFADSNITLNKAESITINVEATATDADYKFDLQATVVVDGKEQTETITGPNRRPFEVTGFAAEYPSAFAPLHGVSRTIVSLGAVSNCPDKCL